MIDLDHLYFEWLLTRLDSDGVTEGVAYICDLLHNCIFERRVGNDINRAVQGANLRKDFIMQFDEADINPRVTNDLMMKECSWLEMLVALAVQLDFSYDGGVLARFLEMVDNLNLVPLMVFDEKPSQMQFEFDQHMVDVITNDVDLNNFDRHGTGGLFPLRKPGHPDQREVEIWDQQAAYFRERLEGVLWTSTS